MRPPTPPKELQETTSKVMDDDIMELEQKEKIELVLFDYEDDENSFSISFEFEYAVTKKIDKDMLLA